MASPQLNDDERENLKVGIRCNLQEAANNDDELELHLTSSSKITPKLSQNFPKITKKFSQNFPKIIPKLSQNYAKIFPKFFENFPKISRKFFEKFAKITQKFSQKFFENLIKIPERTKMNEKVRQR